MRHGRASATRQLSTEECRSWLLHHTEGRLGYRTGRGPRSVVVSYSVSEGNLLMPVPDYNDASRYAVGSAVSFDVDGWDDGGAFAAVHLNGTGRATGRTAPAGSDELGSRPRVAVVSLDLEELHGTLTGPPRSAPEVATSTSRADGSRHCRDRHRANP